MKNIPAPIAPAADIETHDGHAVTDYEADCVLHPWAVAVRFTREESRVYAVEISVLDRDYTFENEVARELSRRGFTVQTSGCGNGITVLADKGFRAPRGFVRIEKL